MGLVLELGILYVAEVAMILDGISNRGIAEMLQGSIYVNNCSFGMDYSITMQIAQELNVTINSID